jgi:hypothetical protein
MKSHVSMERKQCPLCGVVYDTDSLLLDTRGKDSLERYTVTGFKLCSNCYKEGYVALVEIDNEGNGDTLTPDKANKTGRVCHITNKAFIEIFNAELVSMAYIDSTTFEFLVNLKQQEV